MLELKIQEEELHDSKYDALPITYCKNCLSLKVMVLDDEVSYCDDCGCTDTESTDIYTWEKLYKEKYGKTFLNKNKNGRE